MANALELLYENLLKKEEEARSVYLMALQEEKKFENQLNALNQYRAMYSQELNSRGFNQELSNIVYSQYTNFINRLDNISVEQLEGLRKMRQAREQHFAAYKQIEAKRKGIEFLINKRREEREAFLNKQEQKLSDDLSTIKSFAKNKQE
jgi:flagellar FliJ protein